jgi:hypothetical protein
VILKNAAIGDVRDTSFAGGDIGAHAFNTATLMTTTDVFNGMGTGVIVDGGSS